MRGRNRNKGPNPLTRTFESNGPDVKIRGTAHHIAEKYAQLARDAQASGDPVASENYLQHAEHYFRIIAAAQEQLRQQFDYGRGYDDDLEDGDDEGAPANGFGYPAARNGAGQGDDYNDFGSQPQPYESRSDGRPEGRGERNDRNERHDRADRGDRPERSDRGDRNNDRGGQRFDRGERGERRERFPRPDRPPRPEFPRGNAMRAEGDAPQPVQAREDLPPRPPRREEPRREERRVEEARREDVEPAPGGLPAFLTTPVPARLITPPADEAAATPEAAAPEGEDAARFPRRTRRPRRPRVAADQGEAPVADAPADTPAE